MDHTRMKKSDAIGELMRCRTFIDAFERSEDGEVYRLKHTPNMTLAGCIEKIDNVILLLINSNMKED